MIVRDYIQHYYQLERRPITLINLTFSASTGCIEYDTIMKALTTAIVTDLSRSRTL